VKITLDLPEELLNEAMTLTQAKTKSHVIILALEELVRKAKISELRDYKGQINLDIDLDKLRNRNQKQGGQHGSL
jgi:hypothetical protein